MQQGKAVVSRKLSDRQKKGRKGKEGEEDEGKFFCLCQFINNLQVIRVLSESQRVSKRLNGKRVKLLINV